MQVLHDTWFSCPVGVHTCWLQPESDTEAEARGVPPPQIRNRAQLTEVQKQTTEEVREKSSTRRHYAVLINPPPIWDAKWSPVTVFLAILC